MRISATIYTAVLIACLGHASAANAGNCNSPKTAYKTSSVEATTNSSSFKNIANTTVKFTSTAKSCVIVRFSVELYTPFSGQVYVQALLDGDAVPPSSLLFRNGPVSTPEMRSAEFIVNNVSPGKHNVKIRWRIGSSNDVYAYGRTTSVQYR